MKLTPKKIEQAKAVMAELRKQNFLEAIQKAVANGESLKVQLVLEQNQEPVTAEIVLLPDYTWQEADRYYAENPIVQPEHPNPHIH